jgi:hypothetical protein
MKLNALSCIYDTAQGASIIKDGNDFQTFPSVHCNNEDDKTQLEVLFAMNNVFERKSLLLAAELCKSRGLKVIEVCHATEDIDAEIRVSPTKVIQLASHIEFCVVEPRGADERVSRICDERKQKAI